MFSLVGEGEELVRKEGGVGKPRNSLNLKWLGMRPYVQNKIIWFILSLTPFNIILFLL